MTVERAVPRRAVLGLAGAAGATLLLAACGGGSNQTTRNAATLAAGGGKTSTPGSLSTGGVEGGPDPLLKGPAAKFAAAQAELSGSFKVVPPDTYGLSLDTYAASSFFSGTAEGTQLAKEWGFSEGYQVSMEPDGQLAGVLKGLHYLLMEIYLFDAQSGAKAAYDTYESRYAKATGSEQLKTRGLANQSSAWQLVKDTVGSSDLVAVYHRFLFRRGNMLAIAQTYGAQPFMTVDKARDVAVIIDERALGTRQAAEPTPARTTTPGLP